MVTIANCYNMRDVMPIRIALASAGIDIFLPDETVATLEPFAMGLKSAIRVQVAEDDVAQAREVLAAVKQDDGGETQGG